jgi:GTP cyclohydrolase IA
MTAGAVTNLASVLPEHDDDLDLARHDDMRTVRVARAFRGVLDALGLDLADPNLADTPIRVARAYRELLAGLDERAEPELRMFPNDQGYSQMVAVSGIPFQSICAHHFLPFFGTASVAYLPGDRVVGLSKLARVVDFYARRPQLQERMTEQIVELLDTRLRPRGAMVVLEGRHLCLEMRGVRKPGARTRTSAIRGAFADMPLREEFLRTLHTGVTT